MQLSSEEIEKLREHKQRVIEYCSAYTEFGLLNQCNILKNAVGVVGVIVVIGICMLQIIKLAILTITYYIAGALCQPIADDKIVSLLSGMGDTFKVLLAMLISVSVMLIIGITLVIKISNSGLMYR